MSIHVTPIPRLIDLAAPAFTLGTANAAGSAETAVASDSTLLVFDTTVPESVATSSAVGSATVAPRRDHVHAGTVEATQAQVEAEARIPVQQVLQRIKTAQREAHPTLPSVIPNKFGNYS